MAKYKPSEIHKLIADSEINLRREPELAAKQVQEAADKFKEAAKHTSGAVLLSGIAHQAKMSEAAFVKKYPGFHA